MTKYGDSVTFAYDEEVDNLTARQHYWLDSWSAMSRQDIEDLQNSDKWNELDEDDKKLLTRIHQGYIERNNKPLKCRFKIVYS